MLNDVKVFLGLGQVLVLFVAAFFSYAIHTHNRVSRAWLAVSAGLVLMALHRISILLVSQGFFQVSASLNELVGLLVPLLYSLLLAVGLLYMKQNFERFEILEKRAKEKMKAFGALSKPKHRK